MQANCHGATRVPGLHGTDLLALGDSLTSADGSCYWLIRCSQLPVVAHRYHPAASHHSSEDHCAGPSGEHRRTSYRRQIHAAMTWPVPECREMEAANNSRRTGQRPAESLLARVIRARHSDEGCGLRLGYRFGDSRRPGGQRG
jgi:hypothetical protein